MVWPPEDGVFLRPPSAGKPCGKRRVVLDGGIERYLSWKRTSASRGGLWYSRSRLPFGFANKHVGD